MKKKGGGGGGGGGHDTGGSGRWLITYADLITLMMVFFVVLYSMANVDLKKFAALSGSLRGAIEGGGAGAPLPLPGPPGGSGGDLPAPQEDPLEVLGRELAAEAKQSGGQFSVYISRRGLVLSLLGSALFGEGRADIKPEAEPMLRAIAERIKRLNNDISVEGSADNLPISNERFPSNWELSARRATEVLRYFTDRHGLDPNRFVQVGYGEFRPVFPNDTPEDRAKNRRVDVVILRQRQTVELGKPVTGP